MKKLLAECTLYLFLLVSLSLAGYAQSPAQKDSITDKLAPKNGTGPTSTKVVNQLVKMAYRGVVSTPTTLYAILSGGTYYRNPDEDDDFHYILIPTVWVYAGDTLSIDSTAFVIDSAAVGMSRIDVPALKSDGTFFVIEGAEGTGSEAFPAIPTGYVPLQPILVYHTTSTPSPAGIPTQIMEGPSRTIHDVDRVIRRIEMQESLNGIDSTEHFDKDHASWVDDGDNSIVERVDPITGARKHAVSTPIRILEPVRDTTALKAIGGPGDPSIVFPEASYRNGALVNVINGLLFELDRESVATPNDSTIIAAPTGNWLAKSGSGGGAPYSLPTASPGTKGGVKIGKGLEMSGDTLNILAVSTNFIYISPDGDDATGQRGNIGAPFASIAGAKSVFTTGDVITVNPGVLTGQAQLGIAGQTVQYDFSPGSDVSFSGNIITSTSGSVIIRGAGKLSGTSLSYNVSGGKIDIEADEINLTTNFFVLASSTTRFKARAINLAFGAAWAIQHTTSGYFEVETFTHLNNGALSSYVFNRDNTKVDFVNTHFVMSSDMMFYQGSSPYSTYNVYQFTNCAIDAVRIQTSAGGGTTNSFYGRLHFRNTTINTTQDGLYFIKTEPGTEFWFDGVSITAGAGYHALTATQVSGTQTISPKIRILSGGLKTNSHASYIPSREITNLVPYTDAIVDTVNSVTPFVSGLSGLVVSGTPVVTTNAGTFGQVPKSNGDGTATWGTVSGGGGGSGGDADSLGGTPASGYVLTTRTVNGHALSSNVTVTATDLSLGNVDNTSDATKNSASVTLTNKVIGSGSSYTGAVISPTYGGTGINNGSSTITLGGNLTLSGAFNTTFTVTGTTGITLPTTGTLATLAGTETFTNKSISGSTNTLTNIPLGSAVTGTLPVANGGTGQTTASAAFNALSPNTTLGDITYGSGTNTSARLAGDITGTKKYLTQTGTGSVSAAPVWSDAPAALYQYNVKDYGAVGDGTTNDATAINACFAAANAATFPPTIVFPSGTYLTNTALTTLTKAVTIQGINATIKSTSSTFNIINLGSANITITGIKFLGSGTQTAININAIHYFNISACTFTSLAVGIDMQLLGYATFNGGTIFLCDFFSNTRGLYFHNNGEYVEVVGGQFKTNTTAVEIASGNISLNGCNINANTTGVKITTGNNNAHGILSNCNINHNTTGLDISGVTYGETILGCHIYQSPIVVATSSNIVFDNCVLAPTAYTFTSATKTKIQNSQVTNGYSYTITYTSGTNNDVRWLNNLEGITDVPLKASLGGASYRSAQTGTTLDLGMSDMQYRTLTADVTITAITNPVMNKTYRIEIVPAGFTYTLIDNSQLEGTYSTSAPLNVFEITCIDAGAEPRFIGRIYQPGVIVPRNSNNIVWKNLVGTGSISGNNVTKSGPDVTAWTVSADPDRALAGDGYVQFQAATGNANVIFGLATSTSSASYTSIDYGIFVFGTSQVSIAELGTITATATTWSNGDWFRVKVTGSVVTYEKSTNSGGVWTTFATSATAATTFPLIPDFSIRALTTLTDARIYGTSIINNDTDYARSKYASGSAPFITTKTLTATATLDFDLTSVNSQDLTITVTGAADGDAVSVGVPNTSSTGNVIFTWWTSATNTVTIRASRIDVASGANPSSGTFRASVIKY